jgi:hypothetical protein
MALTLNNFIGFETGGTEESSAVTASPAIVTSNVRTGSYALEINADNEAYSFSPFESVSDAGDDQIIGFAVRFNTLPSSDTRHVLRADDSLPIWDIGFYDNATNVVLRATDDSGTTYDGTTALSAARWYYIEIKWQHVASGNFDVFLDGSSEITSTTFDGIGSGTFDTYSFRTSSNGAETYQIDDAYCMSGATGTSDFLGPRTEVLGVYQNTAEDGTDQGDALIAGTWANAGEIPLNDGTAASYAQDAAIGGYTICDEGYLAGPAGDAAGTITGAKYIARLARTNGSSPTTLDQSYGNSGDGVSHTDRAAALGTSYANFFVVSEAATIVPTNSENFAHGMRQTGTGGRDILAHEFAAFLLHTQPAALSTTLADMNFPDQNYYLGPLGT